MKSSSQRHVAVVSLAADTEDEFGPDVCLMAVAIPLFTELCRCDILFYNFSNLFIIAMLAYENEQGHLTD